MNSASPPDPTPARYVVGIDLGTTNSAMTYVDTARRPWRVETFAAEQLVAPGQVEARETLPSFHYQPARGEIAAGALRCPWDEKDPDATVGFFARDQGTMAPGRLICSAKSWLCHSGVDRTADLLPWHGAPDVDRLSPVETSSRYLKHFAHAWNARFARFPLAEQDVVLTLPASFDEVARELTVKAAARAGLPRVVLIEEPQAAFYAWLDRHADDWQQLVAPGQKILVCDVGGGTSDFTLIRVRRGEGGKVHFHRVAVGDHLILGGDNLDLALARYVERRLAAAAADSAGSEIVGGDSAGSEIVGGDSVGSEIVGGDSVGDGDRLAPRAWGVLVRACRQVKETLLGDDAPERVTINLPRAGAKLIGGAQQIEVGRDEVRQVLLDGFFPRVGLEEKPRGRESGFQEFGLPYAPDPAVTRCLAAFLTAHRHVAPDDPGAQADHDPARPDLVLFNGGLFASAAIRRRVIDVLRSWFGNHAVGGASVGDKSVSPNQIAVGDASVGDKDVSPNQIAVGDASYRGWQPLLLEHERLDLAVARGAAYYGMVRRGEGIRIAAGLARTYYIGVESVADGVASHRDPAAVCLLPAGVEPGHDVELPGRRFDLLVSEPVEFPLYVSSTRLTDKPGELVPIDRERMTALPPIRTVLRTRKKSEAGRAAVRLHARLTEIGTLELWCSEIDARRSWRLQFDVRSATQTDRAAHQSAAEAEGFADEATWHQCARLIDATFGPDGREKPAGLVKRLARAIGGSRNNWPASLCRRIWEALMELEAGRRRSHTHEARWLNLLGFCLRPGYGLAVDDWRVARAWTAVQGKLVHPGAQCRGEGWILWRRIGGGLAPGQQQAVAEPLLGPVRGLYRQLTTGRRRGDFTFAPHDTAEVWRLLGSLELLNVKLKIELGNMLVDLLPKRKMATVRPAMAWALGRIGARVPVYGPLNTVVPLEVVSRWLPKLMDLYTEEPLAVMQMARRTDDRYRELSEKLRRKVVAWLQRHDAPAHFAELVEHGGRLDSEEQSLVFGESLPKGLRMA